MQETQFETLKQFIVKAHESGLNDDQIIDKLVQAGWEKSDILQVIRAEKAKQIYSTPTPSNSPLVDDQSQNITAPTDEDPSKAKHKYDLKIDKALNKTISEIFSNFWWFVAGGLVFGALTVGVSLIIGFVLFAGWSVAGGVGILLWAVLAAFIVSLPIAIWIVVVASIFKDGFDGAVPSFSGLFTVLLRKGWQVALTLIMIAAIGYYPFWFVMNLLGISSTLYNISPLAYGLIVNIWYVIIGTIFTIWPLVTLFENYSNPIKAYIRSYKLVGVKGRMYIIKLLILIIGIVNLTNFALSKIFPESGGWDSYTQLYFAAFIYTGGISSILMAILQIFLLLLVAGMFVYLYVVQKDIEDEKNGLYS